MTLLILSGLLLLASHALLSAPAFRPWLIARAGRAAFGGLHSGVSLLALALVIEAYRRLGPTDWLYLPRSWAPALAVGLMPFVLFLITARLTTPCGPADAPLAPKGIYRITRHPGSLGLALWAGLHLLNLGEARTVFVFAVMLAMALFALAKNEWLRRRARRPFLAETSILPFTAILLGRQRLVWREIGWARLAGALAAYAVLLALHPWVIGVDPLAAAGLGWLY